MALGGSRIAAYSGGELGVRCFSDGCGNGATAGYAQDTGLPGCVECASGSDVCLPGRSERFWPLPEAYATGRAYHAVLDGREPTGELWLHQGKGLEVVVGGENLVVATGTASGKSLIFQLAALSLLEGSSDARVAVFYPTKALAQDQLRRWRRALEAMGLPAGLAAIIDGDVAPRDRSRLLRGTRIVLLTPDVCHAWLMRTCGESAQRAFLRGLRLVVLDEAHVYEGVFGSNSAYLFRRLLSLAGLLSGGKMPQVVAATATILDPSGHLERLCGLDFRSVEEEDDGAPRYDRRVYHLSPSGFRGIRNPDGIAELSLSIVDGDPGSRLIVFHDSRQGIERVVQSAGRPGRVVPYRAGYLSEDRRRVERSLFSGSLDVVVSTSALELGIDIPDLNWGVNVGLPGSRKSLKQRLGRVGRSGPAHFVIYAEEDAFSSHGDTLEGYLSGLVEPSHLYLDNESIRSRHGECLRRELRCLGLPGGKGGELPGLVSWPGGFEREFLEGSFDGFPHWSGGLRSAGGEDLSLWLEGEGESIGNIGVHQGIQEAYPGAVYRHRGQSYDVSGWGRMIKTGEALVLLKGEAVDEDLVTRPRKRRMVMPLVESVLKRRKIGLGYVELVRCFLQDSVEGYEVDRNPDVFWYGRKEDGGCGLERVHTGYETTGLHLCFGSGDFEGEGGLGWHYRDRLGDGLVRELGYRRSLELGDLGYAADNVFLRTSMGWRLSIDSLVIFDDVPGGLGLVSPLYDCLDEYGEHFSGVSGGWDVRFGGRLPLEVVSSFVKWVSGDLEPGFPHEDDPWWLVYVPGTGVRFRSGGERGVVCGATWGPGVLYEVDVGGGVVRVASASDIDPVSVGCDWRLWRWPSGDTRRIDCL